MKALVLAVCLLACAPVFAKDQPEMKTAKVISQNIATSDQGAAVVPIGGALVGVPLRERENIIVIEHTGAKGTFRGTIQELYPRHPLVLTVNGTVDYYMEKGKLIILDSQGKKHKFAIVHSEKIGD